MRQERGYFRFGHLVRMTFAMEENVALDPVDVSLLSADAVMFAADDVPHLIKQFRFARWRPSQYFLCHDSDSVLPSAKLKPD